MLEITRQIFIKEIKKEIEDVFIYYRILCASFGAIALIGYFLHNNTSFLIFYIAIATGYFFLQSKYKSNPDQRRILIIRSLIFYLIHTSGELYFGFNPEFLSEEKLSDGIKRLSKGIAFLMFLYSLNYVYILGRVLWAGYYFMLLRKFKKLSDLEVNVTK
jgi:hypothetical protein